jgi:hypothetical protein
MRTFIAVFVAVCFTVIVWSIVDSSVGPARFHHRPLPCTRGERNAQLLGSPEAIGQTRFRCLRYTVNR